MGTQTTYLIGQRDGMPKTYAFDVWEEVNQFLNILFEMKVWIWKKKATGVASFMTYRNLPNSLPPISFYDWGAKYKSGELT